MTTARRLLPWLIDAGMAVGFAALAIGMADSGIDDGYRGSAPVWASVLANGIAPLPLLLRRRRPVLMLALVVALSSVPHLFADLDRPFLGGLVMVVVAYASCVQYARPPWQWLAALFAVAFFAVDAIHDPRIFLNPGEWLFELAIFTIGFAIGMVFRVLRDSTGALERELAAVARAEALRQEARIAAEREYIARELHDVIAHSVTAMVVQAGSARLRLDTEPAAAASALLAVEATGREALGELRRALGLLRAETDAA